MSKQKRKYEKPQITLVNLNPAQAVLSVCSTTSGSLQSSGGGNKCRSGNCKKKSIAGDSLGQS